MQWEYLRVAQRLFAKKANLEEIKAAVNRAYPKSVVNIQGDGGLSTDAQDFGSRALLFDLLGDLGWELVASDQGQALFKRPKRG